MRLRLPPKDAFHAHKLRWSMVVAQPEWVGTSYEYRAQLRQEFDAQMRQLRETAQQAGCVVYNLDPDFVVFAKRTVRRQLFWSYLISAFTGGPFLAIFCVAVLEDVLGRIHPPAEPFGIPVNMAVALLWAWPIATIPVAVALASVRGTWRSRRLVRHAKRATRDEGYLLPI